MALGWGFAWPANRRIMYNRCSADPEGSPGRRRRGWPAQYGGVRARYRGYVYWDPSANQGKGQWVGLDVPDFVVDQGADDTGQARTASAWTLHDGASPFIMKADGKGWLFVPNGLVDGPLPTHYEPYESPVTEPRLQAAEQPGGADVEDRRQPLCRGRLAGLSARPLDVSADRASPERRHEPLAAVAVGVAAGAVLRDLAGARGRAGRGQHGVGASSRRRAARSGPRRW